MKIVELRVENVKRIAVVTIKPDGSLVVIGGENGAGKSSILDSIAMLLLGRGAIPDVPVRKGSERASIYGDLGDIKVERKFTAKGGGSLVVTGADGEKVRSPQALLDSLVSHLAFDPLAFSRMKPAEQFEALQKLVGLDLSELEKEHDTVFAERTDVNREAKRLEGQLSGMAHHEDAPAEEVSVEALMAELQAVEEERGAAGQLTEKAARLGERLVASRGEHESIARARNTADHDFDTAIVVRREAFEAEERRLLAEFTTHRETVAAEQLTRSGAIEALEGENTAAKKAAGEARAAVQDPQPLRDQIAAADGQNQKLRENTARAAVKVDLNEKAKLADQKTARLSAIAETKRKAIAAAEFPVKGLSLEAGTVLFNGIPYDQASSAEQLRVSASMGLAANPQLPVMLIREGSLLDKKSLAMLGKMAAEVEDGQVWIERVGTDEATSVVIEDGMVAGA